MVNIITGPKGSGKTQHMIALANEKVNNCIGNVVLIKKSLKGTSKADFKLRVICMEEYKDILTLEEFVGFIYGMLAGNHDISTVFIDGILKQANINLDSLPDFLQKIQKISENSNIDFVLSVSAKEDNMPKIDTNKYTVLAHA
ncbi:MAG: hypothetical protein FWE25_02610 [Lachnospiraceae bacterium]|nr:hypothetical protein [Lachnospiraceae bacterium]